MALHSPATCCLAHPGFADVGAFIATVEYNVTNGDMKVGPADVSPIFSNQPTGNVMVAAPVIECDQAFNANISTPFASSSALRRPLLSLALYTVVILVGILNLT
ncbi:uncharacterized protein LACBIDRAFT_303591 [Laccaria bicolor S238N-H82]|uniref:Predicted protein n=1 Tax=Laccaria bicolor (strain S238N-H82 / ATCC MYA-4686) TaxID=486041 RepID=B0DJT1_LACBS|nr:uncharacterized protein LACBIDRAFT_303591 [Laccaria bicolor S238N-H82]EDR05261.1 predicted protein [Laccaria bicolor S238N-H82]|eukprot:XP_001884226.1 predicted protein [Laccaria bicolor S238N-H82]